MAEHKKEAAFRLPPLQALEEEGWEAADELAREILRDTLATGGRIDMQRLDQAGPPVRSAYLRCLAEMALPPARAQREVTKAATPPPPAVVVSPAKPVAPVAQGKSKPLPRTKLGWYDQQRPDVGFKVHAFRCGMLIAIVLGTIAITAIRFLKL